MGRTKRDVLASGIATCELAVIFYGLPWVLLEAKLLCSWKLVKRGVVGVSGGVAAREESCRGLGAPDPIQISGPDVESSVRLVCFPDSEMLMQSEMPTCL